MRKFKLAVVTCVGLTIVPFAANAGVCDWRASELLGGGGAVAVGGGAAAGSAIGLAIKGAGFYTLTHAITGATMVGSTLLGTSAAGTVGIIAGTGGIIGTAVAIITGPFVVIGGLAVGTGVGALELGCYFTDERVTEYSEVMAYLQRVAETANPDVFRISEITAGEDDGASVHMRISENETETFSVRDLYIVNGSLRVRRWGPDRTLGQLYLIQ